MTTPPRPWAERRREIRSRPLPQLKTALERAALRAVLLFGSSFIETENEERYAHASGPVLLAINHLNNLEAVLTPSLLFWLRGGEKVAFLSDWMFRYYPVLSWMIRQSETITVWRKDARLPGMNVLKRNAPRTNPLIEAEERIRKGQSVAFYPEGRRNRNPHELLRGHEGIARVALATGAPVIPLGIDFRGRESAARVPRWPHLIYRFGEPLSFPDEVAALRAAEAAARDGRLPHAERRRLEKDVTARVMLGLAELSGKRLPRRGRVPLRGVAPPETPASEAAIAGAAAAEDAETITVEKVTGESQRASALEVVRAVYVEEKGWMDREELDGFPGGSSISWYLVRVGGAPAGLLRLVYDPPLSFPPGYDVRLREGIDWVAIAKRARIVEVGRFMIVPRWRTRPRVVLRLMNAATREVVERGYTHLLTDVFEGDPHSPYEFHTRVLGFQQIGTHTHGEMKTSCRRIILALDIQEAFLRMRARGGRMFAEFTAGYRHLLEERVAASGRAEEPGQQGTRARS